MAFRWRVDDDPLIVVFGSSYKLKKKTRKIKEEKVVEVVVDPLTKLSGSAHGLSLHINGKRNLGFYRKIPSSTNLLNSPRTL